MHWPNFDAIIHEWLLYVDRKKLTTSIRLYPADRKRPLLNNLLEKWQRIGSRLTWEER